MVANIQDFFQKFLEGKINTRDVTTLEPKAVMLQQLIPTCGLQIRDPISDTSITIHNSGNITVMM